MEATRLTLLSRLRDPRGTAWEDFYVTYGPVMQRYAARLGLDQAAAQDVVQESVLALLRILPTFRYDPDRGLFRNFVLTVVHRKVQAALRRRTRLAETSADAQPGEAHLSLLDRLPASTPLPQEQMHLAWQQSLWEEALARVRRDPTIQPHTWDVFHAYVLEDRAAAEVAASFSLKPNAVYQIRNRMLARIREEIAFLTAQAEPATQEEPA